MRLPKVNFCGCGCSLEQGSLLIGWTGIALGFLIIYKIMVAIVVGPYSGMLVLTTAGNVIALIMSFALMVASLILVVAIHRKATGYMRIYLWLMVLLSSLVSSSFLASSIILMVRGDSETGLTIFVMLFFGIPFVLYLLLVVYNYERKIYLTNLSHQL